MSERAWSGPLEKIDDYHWRIPQAYDRGMRVPGLIFADEKLLRDITSDQSLQQVANVAHLPGIVKASMAMPDIHWGYGAPIGGVAAFDAKDGIVSPGMTGYDINCGVRLVRTELTVEEVQPKLRALIAQLFRDVPCGVGMSGEIRISRKDAPKLMAQGSRWVIQQGYGAAADVEHTESQGCLPDADPSAVSERALQRGHDQLGTLGSGNHFMEVQAVETIYDEQAANAFGLFANQVTVMIHSGSRGFGYQICDDYLDVTGRAMAKYGISVPDRQLACAPINSEEGRAYLGAMRCAANFAWANRQCLMHLARMVFERLFERSWEALGMQLVYDVAHNIAKFERHTVPAAGGSASGGDGKERTVCVHRKGATRAFPPGHPDVPEDYRPVGQPVIIPGDMGRNSYVLAGTQAAMEQTFGSCCHGAGRVMSRTEAVRRASGRSIEGELERRGIIVMGRGRKGVAEEQPDAYKDVNDVVRVVHNAGLAKRVARMRPLGVIKG
ncbi:MAG: RtcB family protein [Candidatus Omnitrophica bacterium]|nr:RtcB family protein [Candidatus Omnitrophota bacterium]